MRTDKLRVQSADGSDHNECQSAGVGWCTGLNAGRQCLKNGLVGFEAVLLFE
jgi:hypothetical protein